MIEFTSITDSLSWDNLVRNFEEANFLHAWQWGEAFKANGQQVERIAIIKQGLPIGCFQAIVQVAKRGRYLEIAGGPLIDWSKPENITEFTKAIKKLARQHRCIFVRIRPQVEKNPQTTKLLKKLNWRPAPMHLHAEHTSIIDLEKDNDSLLSAMRQQTRYEVKRAAKRGVTIHHLSTAEAIKEFHNLQTTTASRQHFIPSKQNFLVSLQKQFKDQVRVYYAKKDDQLLNMSIVIFYGQEVDYFEAASTLPARKEPGAYGIIWQIIQDAKQMNLTRLNLWGIASNNNPKHRYAGVTTFKKGFGGANVNYLPAQDLIVNPLLYPFSWTIETVRRKRRKL